MSTGAVPACLLLMCSGWVVAHSAVRAASSSQEAPPRVTDAPPAAAGAALAKYCFACHNQRLRTGGLALDTLDVTKPHANSELWERVIAKLRARSMPPSRALRPDAATYQALISWLESDIDRSWDAAPDPGRPNAVHRLN
ncbi:MAG: hypothetical protein HY654_08840, partial [Acidobacteria bacterium]|nr:hypothetical protein [Acidobacteriota bacterium]